MCDEQAAILVVDDEPFNLEIINELLGDAGFEVVLTEDAGEAWTLLETQAARFAVVLLDRMLPGMDGLELLLRIKAHPTIGTIPVILQTARAGRQDVAEGMAAGAFDYLAKPFDREALLDMVNRAVAQRTQVKGER